MKSVNAQVFLRRDEDFQNLMKRWNNAVHSSDIMKEMRNKEYYVKPSVRKRMKQRERMANQEN